MTAGGEVEDLGRYTAVFTGLLDLRRPGEYPYLRIGEAGEPSSLERGRPPYSTLGREVRFGDLPERAQTEIRRLYTELWNL